MRKIVNIRMHKEFVRSSALICVICGQTYKQLQCISKKYFPKILALSALICVICGQTFAQQIFILNKFTKKTSLLYAFFSEISGQIFEQFQCISKKYSPKILALSALICVICGQTFAQQINLPAALDSALNNNLNVKNEKLKVDYQKKLIQTGANIPQTMVNAEYGQINSIYTDTRFGVFQSLNFPSVYSFQKSALKSLWKSSNISVALKEVELKKQVRQTFYSYLYLLQKQKLLQSNDTMYIGFLTKATARFKSGESNVLEFTTAENQRAQISIQLNQLNTDMELLLMQFQLLLNTSISYIPSAENFKIDNSNIADSNVIENHPTIKLLLQQKQYSLVNTRLEKARLLPELTLAYSNMSIKGVGADNIDYAYEKRFQAAQIGIGIPLFFKSFNAKIGASKLEQLMADNRLKTETNLMNAEWNKTNAQYLNYLKTITIYESKTLNNAQLIIETANKQFANGDINYIEWVMLTNQAIAIKNEYLNGVYNLNESIIQLNYLSNK